jgi:Mn-dependent DtxR family transcriptional regulator
MSFNLFMNSSLWLSMSKSSVSGILNAISEERSLALLENIAIQKNDSEELISKLKLSPKQFYSRIYLLMKAGLIKRERGKYYLTSLGKVTYNFSLSLQHAVNNYWKLMAIDSFEMSRDEISKDERAELINALVGDDDKLKAIIVDIF